MSKNDKRAWAWTKLKESHDSSTPVTVRVSQVVKGGLTVHATEIGGLRGFIPASHVELRRVKDLSVYVGEVFPALVEAIDIEKKKVVFSRRALLMEDGKRRVSDAIMGLTEGAVLDGVVSNITDTGVFVTVGEIYGLVDRRAVSWNLELDFREARTVGEEVRARVLRVKKDKGHVIFDIRDTEPDPWIDHARTHQVGQLVYGRAVTVLPHCAYFEIAWGVYGYVHISELSDEVPSRATDVVSPGDEMWLKLIGHDPRSRYDRIAARMFPSDSRRGEGRRSPFSHVNADGTPKLGYRTHAEADDKIREIGSNVYEGVLLYSYVCDTCGLWHYGSRSEEFWTLSKLRADIEGGEVAADWKHAVSDQAD